MKNWTRPKIKVQKFVPNFCTTACFSELWVGEAWVDDAFHGGMGNNPDTFSLYDGDYYSNNWLGTPSGSIKIPDDDAHRIPANDAWYLTGNRRPPEINDPNTDYEWEYLDSDWDLGLVPEGSGKFTYYYVIFIDGVPTHLARTKTNAS